MSDDDDDDAGQAGPSARSVDAANSRAQRANARAQRREARGAGLELGDEEASEPPPLPAPPPVDPALADAINTWIDRSVLCGAIQTVRSASLAQAAVALHVQRCEQDAACNRARKAGAW
jgi:hypothetical protein